MVVKGLTAVLFKNLIRFETKMSKLKEKVLSDKTTGNDNNNDKLPQNQR